MKKDLQYEYPACCTFVHLLGYNEIWGSVKVGGFDFDVKMSKSEK
jgi:hypothetical protein